MKADKLHKCVHTKFKAREKGAVLPPACRLWQAPQCIQVSISLLPSK